MGQHHWAVEVMVSIVAIYVLGVSAQIRVSVRFSPVPVTAQTLAVLLIGAFLGRRRAVGTLVGYLLAGAIGLPFFAGAGLAGPTGGYLVGFVPAAFFTGLMAERGWDRHPVTAFLTSLGGAMVIYVFGLLWLARFVGPGAVLALGLLPFVVGDLIKVVCAAIVMYARARL